VENFPTKFPHSNNHRLLSSSTSSSRRNEIIRSHRKPFLFYINSKYHQSIYKTCDICQRIKGPFPRLGHLPVKKGEINPWEEVQIDLVGPWTFQIPPKWFVSVLVLTCIDPFSGLCDACRLENKSPLPYGCHDIHALSDASTTTAQNSLRLHFNIYYSTTEFKM